MSKRVKKPTKNGSKASLCDCALFILIHLLLSFCPLTQGLGKFLLAQMLEDNFLEHQPRILSEDQNGEIGDRGYINRPQIKKNHAKCKLLWMNHMIRGTVDIIFRTQPILRVLLLLPWEPNPTLLGLCDLTEPHLSAGR